MSAFDRDRPRSLLRPIAAGGLLAIGSIGLVLPLVPGIPFLIAGAWFLRRHGHVTESFLRVQRRELTFPERVQVALLRMARRVTMAAEAMRVALDARQRER